MTAPISVRRGDSAEWEFPVKKADGTALDITGATFRFMAKARGDDADGAALITATTANGKCVITNAALGLMEVRLVPADTDGLAAPAVLAADLQVREAAGKVWTVWPLLSDPKAGKLLVRSDISRTVP